MGGGSYLKLGGQVVLYGVGGGHNLQPLVEIGLTDLLKHGCAIAHPAHLSPTPLQLHRHDLPTMVGTQ